MTITKGKKFGKRKSTNIIHLFRSLFKLHLSSLRFWIPKTLFPPFINLSQTTTVTVKRKRKGKLVSLRLSFLEVKSISLPTQREFFVIRVFHFVCSYSSSIKDTYSIMSFLVYIDMDLGF